ncbi:cupin domain-containing protein [Streptantibioticus ferralitis]|uniref:Cupin domain-containing protein n=1 Tax=Streptantibioticus ferralitis TaxID=236510 RepID=A0ABT5YY80_9ACTN|nr:cupin domain-containing protein [Streptantibioticus ferralitis]MDF2256367.1 cupin domain-containing protein [Streptantibioticus ferralitis]
MTPLADRERAALSARPVPDLSRLIDPIDVHTFRREHWERQPLFVKRSDPGYFADLLTLADVDEVLWLSGTDLRNIRVVIDGKETPVDELKSTARQNALEALYEHYRNGSTVVLNSLGDRWAPLRRLGSVLGAELSARIQCNIYVTPAGNRGFVPHYDTHDVFIAQVHGTKHWRLAGQPYALPLHGRPYDKSQPEPEPEQEIDLSAGDLLYLPRGTVHSAASNETTSVHITIGVHPLLYSDVVEHAVKRLFAEEEAFRKGLPMGFATDEQGQSQAVDQLVALLGVLRDRLSPREMVTESVRRAISIAAPTLDGHLTDLERLGEVEADTKVIRRPDLRWTLAVDEEAVQLTFHDKTVQFPAHVADEVRYVAQSNGAGFTGASIPGDLDQPGRAVLVRTLMREGFITFA